MHRKAITRFSQPIRAIFAGSYKKLSRTITPHPPHTLRTRKTGMVAMATSMLGTIALTQWAKAVAQSAIRIMMNRKVKNLCVCVYMVENAELDICQTGYHRRWHSTDKKKAARSLPVSFRRESAAKPHNHRKYCDRNDFEWKLDQRLRGQKQFVQFCRSSQEQSLLRFQGQTTARHHSPYLITWHFFAQSTLCRKYGETLYAPDCRSL